MVDGVYLSEAIKLEDIKPYQLNLITSNCGSGKTYCALHKFPELASRREHVVYLVDTIALRDVLGMKDECKIYDPSDEDILNGKIINFDEVDNQIIVMTYAKMGLILKRKPKAFDGVEVIICDEIHQVPKYIGIERRKVQKQHPHASKTEISSILSFDCGAYLAAINIERFAAGLDENGNNDLNPKRVIALSATPAKAYALFSSVIEDIKIDAVLRAYETLTTYYYTDLIELLRGLDKETKTLLYVPRITDMLEARDIVRSMGIRAECIWSPKNEKHKMTEEQYALRDYILKYESIPDEYDFVFYNSAYETGINITDESISRMVIHTLDSDDQIQSRNRKRGDLITCHILANEEQRKYVSIPYRFLNVPLGKEEKNELCNYLKIKNKNGVQTGWTTAKKFLIENGYSIKTTHPRENGKRVSKDILTYNE